MQYLGFPIRTMDPDDPRQVRKRRHQKAMNANIIFIPCNDTCEPCFSDEGGRVSYDESDDIPSPQSSGYTTPEPEIEHQLRNEKTEQAAATVNPPYSYPSNHLLSIPSELRLTIYFMIDPEEKIMQGVEVRPTLAFRTRRNSKARLISHLSLTCKRLHREVMDFYYDNLQASIDVGIFAGHKKDCFPRQMSESFNVHFAQVRSLDLYVEILPLMTQSQMAAMLGWLEHLMATLRMSEHLATFRFEVKVSGQTFTSRDTGEGDFRGLRLRAPDELRKTLPMIRRSASTVS